MAAPNQTYTDNPSATAGLPHSREAEEAVVGAALINEETYYQVSLILRDGAQEFYIHRLRYIWEAMTRLVGRKEPLDILTVSVELDDMGRLAEIGGQAYLTALLNQCPTTLHAQAYGRMVDATYIRRKALTAGNQIATAAYDADASIQQVIAEGSKAWNDVLVAARPDSLVHISVAVKEADAGIEAAKARRERTGQLPGIATGFTEIDTKLGGGAQDSDLLMVAARPGHGKTSFLLQTADYAARVLGKKVVIFSLEMKRDRLIERWISQVTGIDSQLLHAGLLTDQQAELYYQALEEINALPVTIDDDPVLTPTMLRTKLELLYSSNEVDLVLIDYLMLIEPEQRYRTNSEMINAHARDLKQFARRFNLPIWVLHQMNRNIDKKNDDSFPTLSDLNEGGERDPDLVAFLHHQLNDDGQIVKSFFVIAKHRNGPVGIVPLRWISSTTKFETIKTRQVSKEA